MTTRSTVCASVPLLLMVSLAAPAAAQFDPLHNHLRCFRIEGGAIVKTVVADHRFGRERVVKLVPKMLCVPAAKTCCAPGSARGCEPTPCPSAKQPAPADHFVCYKAAARSCLDQDCSRLGRFDRKTFAVNLRDQFGIETVDVGPPLLLCAPAAADVVRPPSTTTTTIPCDGMITPGESCGGRTCPPGLTCLTSGLATCACVPPEEACGEVSGGCAGRCAITTQECTLARSGACECTTPCGFSGSACDGSCSNPNFPVCTTDAAGNCVCSNGTCLNRGSACTERAQCCSNLCQENDVCA